MYIKQAAQLTQRNRSKLHSVYYPEMFLRTKSNQTLPSQQRLLARRCICTGRTGLAFSAPLLWATFKKWHVRGQL